MELNLIQTIAIYALPVIFAITLHEAAHGYVARHFGDTTAWRLGRVSLNPVRHIDPVGTIIVPLVMLVASAMVGGRGLLFGWAKPVPVNFSALRNPKADMLWVALAGPAANLLMALIWALLAKIAVTGPPNFFSQPLWLMAAQGVQLNIGLMALNLLPIPPLDGGRVVTSLLPMRLAVPYSRIEPYGIPILLALIILPPVIHIDLLQAVLVPPVAGLTRLIERLFQI